MHLCIQCMIPHRGGLPHSDTPGSKLARSSSGIFAACHVLHRLLVPRHPPNALLLLNQSNQHRNNRRRRRGRNTALTDPTALLRQGPIPYTRDTVWYRLHTQFLAPLFTATRPHFGRPRQTDETNTGQTNHTDRITDTSPSPPSQPDPKTLP